MPKTKAFQIRMTAEQWEAISSFAERVGLPIADVMIQGAMQYIARETRVLQLIQRNLKRRRNVANKFL